MSTDRLHCLRLLAEDDSLDCGEYLDSFISTLEDAVRSWKSRGGGLTGLLWSLRSSGESPQSSQLELIGKVAEWIEEVEGLYKTSKVNDAPWDWETIDAALNAACESAKDILRTTTEMWNRLDCASQKSSRQVPIGPSEIQKLKESVSLHKVMKKDLRCVMLAVDLCEECYDDIFETPGSIDEALSDLASICMRPTGPYIMVQMLIAQAAGMVTPEQQAATTAVGSVFKTGTRAFLTLWCETAVFDASKMALHFDRATLPDERREHVDHFLSKLQSKLAGVILESEIDTTLTETEVIATIDEATHRIHAIVDKQPPVQEMRDTFEHALSELPQLNRELSLCSDLVYSVDVAVKAWEIRSVFLFRAGQKLARNEKVPGAVDKFAIAHEG